MLLTIGVLALVEITSYCYCTIDLLYDTVELSRVGFGGVMVRADRAR